MLQHQHGESDSDFPSDQKAMKVVSSEGQALSIRIVLKQSQTAEANSSSFILKYDDGQTEWLDLSTEEFVFETKKRKKDLSSHKDNPAQEAPRQTQIQTFLKPQDGTHTTPCFWFIPPLLQ